MYEALVAPAYGSQWCNGWWYIRKRTGETGDPLHKPEVEGLVVSIMLSKLKDIFWLEVKLAIHPVIWSGNKLWYILVIRDCGSVLLKAPDMLCVRKIRKWVRQVLPVFLCVCFGACRVSIVVWRSILRVAITDLPVTAPKCVSSISLVYSSTFSTHLAAIYSRIFLRIDTSNIGCQDLGSYESQFDLEIVTHVECFYLVEKWLRMSGALYSTKNSWGCILYAIAGILFVILLLSRADCWFAKCTACDISSEVMGEN